MERGLAFVVACSLVVGCSDSEVEAPPGGAPAAALDLVEEPHAESLERIADREVEFGSTPADLEALAGFLRTLPDIARADVSLDDRSVVASFKDGVPLTIVRDRDPIEEPNAEGTDGMSTRKSPTNIGATPRVTFMKSMGDAFQSNALEIKGWFEKAGYEPLITHGSIEEWKDPATFRGASLVDVQAHGGWAKLASQEIVDYTLWTSTCVRNDRRTPRPYRDDMISGHLGFMFAGSARSMKSVAPGCLAREKKVNGHVRIVNELHYAILPSFVRKYVHLEPQTMLVLNACNSMTDASKAMRAAFTEAGAGPTFGWTAPVTDPDVHYTTSYLYDRMLGANAFRRAPNPRIDDWAKRSWSKDFAPESPPQRPFDFLAVHSKMAAQGLTTRATKWEGRDVLLRFELDRRDEWSYLDDEAGFGLFVPSIEHALLTDRSMSVWGVFGSDPGKDGKVMLGSTELPIKSWKPRSIEVELPPLAAQPAPLQVIVRGHASNAVPITEWKGTLHVVQTDVWTGQTSGTVRATLDIDVRLLGDVHAYRSWPHADPSPSWVTVRPRPESRVRFAISGALTHTRYDGTLESETVSARPVEHDMTKWYWDLAGPDTLHMGQGPATQHLWFKSWVPVAQGRKDGVYDDDFEFTAPYLKLLMNPTYVITAEPYEKSVTSGSLVRTTQVTIELLPQGPPTASTSS